MRKVSKMLKNKVIETKDAREKIIEKLSDEGSIFYLVESMNNFNIVLDEGAKEVLRKYYEAKREG